jgi:threonine dehydrogenase-like Zn-dependent dehydrogenase
MPIEMPRRPLFAKEINFVVSRSTGPGRYDANYERGGMDYPIAYVRWTGRRNQAECARLISSGALNIEPLVSHDFPFSAAPDALELATTKGPETLGIVLAY